VFVNAKYHLGSDRRALAVFWLSFMSKDVMSNGAAVLRDADIHEQKLPSTLRGWRRGGMAPAGPGGLLEKR
jgi:hypothetical protein